MLFGDSSLGEFHWDGICLAIMALFAHEVVRRAAGFKWGLVAAATVLTLVMQGPPWIYWGVGLSEHAAAGFIYAAALTTVMATSWRLRLAAGVLAILGFFVRLNNLPIAFAIAVFAIPLDVRVRDLWTPRQWLPRVDWRTAGWVIGAAAIGDAALLAANVVLHRRLLVLPGHDAWHQCASGNRACRWASSRAGWPTARGWCCR